MDLVSAYLQIPLDKESKMYTTINNHKGLYCYNQFPFGVASAPSIFQSIMESIMQGINHVCIYLDDILVTGATERLEGAVKYINVPFCCLQLNIGATKLQPRVCSLLITTSKHSMNYMRDTPESPI